MSQDPDALKAARDLAVETAGGASPLARALGLTHQAVIQWKRVPVEHVLEIERLLGISRYVLRPDVYGSPPLRQQPRSTEAAA